ICNRLVFAEREIMEYRGRQLFRLDVRKLDDLAPFLGLVCDKLAKLSGRTTEGHAPKFGKLRPNLGIGKRLIDLLVESFDDFGWSAFGRANTKPRTRREARYEVTHCRKVRQCLHARRSGDCQGTHLASA